MKQLSICVLVSCLSFCAQAAPVASGKPIVLLTRSSDDATVDYFRNLLTAYGLPFTELTAAQVNAGSVANSILIAGFSAEPTEFKGVASVIGNAVNNGSWLICEAYGDYLAVYANVGSITTGSTDPVVLDHHAFVAPVDSSSGALFNGIPTWNPPSLPDEPAQYTEYYLKDRVYTIVYYAPPSSAQVFSYWNLNLTYGWNFQSTSSAYCQSWGGCTGERSVVTNSVYLATVGSGKVLVGPDGIGILAGYTQYGPALDKIHLNAIALAGAGSPPAYDLSSAWSNSGNPNGPWSYRQGSTPLPLVPDWNGSNTTWASSCNQPAWAPSNAGGNFLPAFFNINACAAAHESIAPGEVTVHTVDSFNGNPSLGAANVLFTLPASAAAGTYTIAGSLWDTYSDSISAGRPQDWLLLLNGTQIAAGRLSGSVSRGQAQIFSLAENLKVGDQVQLQIAKDAASSAGYFVSMNLTITPAAGPLQIPGGGGATQVTLAGGSAPVLYSQTLPASGGSPPYAWSLLGGTLPTGLYLNGSGIISGTPTQPGTFAFTARATDTSGASVSAIFVITIAPQGLAITTLSPLPNGIAGSDYPAQIMTATGGNPPYTFQATGTLPGGLVFSGGQITGIPATTGTFNFTVTATDATASTATASFQLTVQQTHADLILSQASLGFALSNGAQGLPAGASVSVRSSDVSQLLHYSIGVTPAAPWLDVTGPGTTPGAIGINLDPKALSLGAGTSQTSIVVACIAPSPCAGNSQTIKVTLKAAAAPPQLAVSTSLLSFSAQTSNPQPVSQTIGLQNVGGGTITVSSVTAKDSFVTIAGTPATIPAGPAIPVTVTVNPAGLSGGFYQSTIFVNTSAGRVNVPLTLFLAPNATMTLSPAGTQFQMQAGSAPGNASGSFLVGVSAGGTANWSAQLLPGANWLTLNTGSGSSTSANPGSVIFTVNSAAAALAPQAYYGTIQVTSSDVIDSPLIFLVVLNVAPQASPARPDPEPAGLLFIANGTNAPASQTVQVFAGSPAPVSYQASSDSAWLQVSPATGSSSSGAPASSTVSVSLTGLAPGVYRGGVSYAFSGAAVRTVNITLIVEAAAAAPASRISASTTSGASTCSPTRLVPAETSLVNNFSQPTAWPAPLAVLLVNDCGQPVTGGQVVATFSNGDPPLVLDAASASSGIYSGTWTPRSSSGQVTVSARATATGFPAALIQVTGQVTPNAVPIIVQNGTLNVFGPVIGAPVAPGTIVQIYGSNFAAQATASATIPLPASLDQTSIIIGGMQAPLYYVSPGQINAQVPFELPAGKPYEVIVNANGAFSTPNQIQLTSVAPGVAQYPAGQIIAQHGADNSLVTEASPAAPGETIVFYVAGMGLTNQTVASGTASPYTLASALDVPVLTLNGTPVTDVPFAGLTPSLVGLYQVNFQVPVNAPDGDLQLTLSQTGGQSNSTILPVHR